MQSLAKRHEDRAKRKAENLAASEETTGPSLSFVESQMRHAQRAFSELSDEEKEEVRAALEAGEENDDRSLAEDPTGAHTLAGIGTINAAVVPVATLARQDSGEGGAGASSASKDAGWGETAPPSIKTPEAAPAIVGNISGDALQKQGAGSEAATGGTSGEGTTGGETGNGAGSGSNS